MGNEIFKKLVDDYLILPKTIKLPTYLGLCRYPANRFEEICSRLLVFFLQPKNEHNLYDLVFKSLIECLSEKDGKDYSDLLLDSNNNIKIKSEEYAEGKRIDIVITGNSFIIGIENKITAGLYNPFDVYFKKLVEANKDITIGIVLSLRKIRKQSEVDFKGISNFINVTYTELFKKIKSNFGRYSQNTNEKYLLFLKDFIETIENMDNSYTFNRQIDDFFYENSKAIEEMSNSFIKYKQAIYTKKSDALHSLFHDLKEKTDLNWEIWENKALFCIKKINSTSIGIECWFEETKENPLGKFVATITSWEPVNLDIFKSFREKFEVIRYYEQSNRPYYIVLELENSDHFEICEKLLKVSEDFTKADI